MSLVNARGFGIQLHKCATCMEMRLAWMEKETLRIRVVQIDNIEFVTYKE